MYIRRTYYVLSSWSAINRIFRPGPLIGRSAVPPAEPVADSARFLINSSTLLTIININNITNSTSSAHVGYLWCITPSAPSDILISLLFSGFCSVSVLFLVLLLSPVYLLNPFLPRVDILSFSPIKTLLPPPLGLHYYYLYYYYHHQPYGIRPSHRFIQSLLSVLPLSPCESVSQLSILHG